ncbi:ubiquitin-like protein [Noumeavirus]|uniref:Ubiquitin-like protein n=1 Tax=Marseillevirus sp. TaxID=2809551 RepID=A0AA96J3Q2_9VIRU|nr:ubiquitin-like protein [Noumeavirus]AQM73218.1 ubiquitin-like protein [Noumeavirus]WNL50325.1 ubiquitin-like protein [Marseillevirus sp.]
MRKLCDFEGCHKRKTLFGGCKFCGLTFCSGHFQPEIHSCQNIQTCRKDAFEKNKNFLLSCAHTASKIRT